jgi:hypothetical protein
MNRFLLLFILPFLVLTSAGATAVEHRNSPPKLKRTSKYKGEEFNKGGMIIEPNGSGRAHKETRILLTGDSLMESMGPQMQKAMAGYKNIVLRPIGKRSTGLARPDFYNWPKVLEENLIDFKPHIVVMWVGTNDPQNIYGYKDLGEPLSNAWQRAYTAKVVEIIKLCRHYNAQLIFIGPPSVADAQLDAQLRKISYVIYNICKVYSETKNYVIRYVSARAILGDDNGNYLHEKLMPNGRIATIRWKDQVHITGDGNLLVMTDLMTKLGEMISGTPKRKGTKELRQRWRGK